jgi:hypothetical protein
MPVIKNLTQIFMFGVSIGGVYFLSIYALVISIRREDWIFTVFFLLTTIFLSGIIDCFFNKLKRCQNESLDKT